jgi:hypothetical protein
MNRSLARKVVGLVAAYAVALGTLLPVLLAALGPAAGGQTGLAVICSAGGAGPASPGHQPINPLPLCPACATCAMAGCATMAAWPAGPALARAAEISSARVAPKPAGSEPQAPRLAGINLARAPPAA